MEFRRVLFRSYSGAAKLTTEEEALKHQIVTRAVHEAGGKICMQILHAGRYAYSPKQLAPCAIQAPINPLKPQELDEEGSEKKKIGRAAVRERVGQNG